MHLIETALFTPCGSCSVGVDSADWASAPASGAIALGAIVVLITGESVDLKPEVFFLLFLPPLLFVDGGAFPKPLFIATAP